LHNVFIRTPLKALQQSLPGDHFLQIHRSHLVNLMHVSGFSKDRRAIRLIWTQNEVILPVSRYRLSDLRTRLMDYSDKKLPPPFLPTEKPD